MDVSKVTAALAEAQTQLNAVIDEEFKARRLKGLRPLTLAQNAITLAEKHVGTATERLAPKGGDAEAGGETSTATAGAGKPQGGGARRTAAAAK